MARRTRGDFNAPIFFCHSLLLRVVPSLKVTWVSAVGWLSAFLYFFVSPNFVHNTTRSIPERDNGDKRRKKEGRSPAAITWKNYKGTVAKIRIFNFIINAIFGISSSKGGGDDPRFTNSDRRLVGVTFCIRERVALIDSSFYLRNEEVCYVDDRGTIYIHWTSHQF